MRCTQEGIVLANVVRGKHGISDTKDGKNTQLACEFQITHFAINGEWADAAQDLTIDGYFYFFKSDGSLNTATIDKLKEAFGWDGVDPYWLQDNDLSTVQVQLTLENEEYKGKLKLKVKWLDVPGAEHGGIKRTEGDDRRRITDKLASKLRALSGGVVTGPPKPAGRPAAVTPAAAPAPVAPPAADGPPTATAPAAPVPLTIKYVWDRWCLACKSKEKAGELWKSIVVPMFPGVIVLADEHAQRVLDEAFAKLDELPF